MYFVAASRHSRHRWKPSMTPKALASAPGDESCGIWTRSGCSPSNASRRNRQSGVDWIFFISSTKPLFCLNSCSLIKLSVDASPHVVYSVAA